MGRRRCHSALSPFRRDPTATPFRPFSSPHFVIGLQSTLLRRDAANERNSASPDNPFALCAARVVLLLFRFDRACIPNHNNAIHFLAEAVYDRAGRGDSVHGE
jgi:hypothetical protein